MFLIVIAEGVLQSQFVPQGVVQSQHRFWTEPGSRWVPPGISSLTTYRLLLFSFSVLSDSLWSHGLQHTGLPCPSLSPRVCSNSCPLSWWCHPIISSSVVPLAFCPQSFPASESFPMSRLFKSCGQNIGVSALASVLPMNILGQFLLGLTGLIYRLRLTWNRGALGSLPCSTFCSFLCSWWTQAWSAATCSMWPKHPWKEKYSIAMLLCVP